MIVFPAIDLKDGKCVRLFKGDMNKTTIFSNAPAVQALEFQNSGFKFLHIVDLDGAVTGKSSNEESIKAILQAIKIPVQLGGGIRSLAAIENWLNLGVNRVILGTVAATDSDLVKTACKKFPGKIVVGIDSKSGRVATEGWIKTSDINALDLAKQFDLARKLEDCGVAAIIYTDISRDGTMSGPDFIGTKHLAQNLTIPVIASGGVSCLDDLIKVKSLEKYGVIGAVVGRALYDKKIDPKDLLAL